MFHETFKTRPTSPTYGGLGILSGGDGVRWRRWQGSIPAMESLISEHLVSGIGL